MHEFTVQFSSLADVMRFVALSTKMGFPIMVGSESYHVNGTSFMGMFTLNWSRPQHVLAQCTNEEAENFRREATQFLAE